MTAVAEPATQPTIKPAAPAETAAAPRVGDTISDMVLAAPLVLHARPAMPVSDDDYFAFCQHNPHLRVECTAEGEWILMPPTGGETSERNSELNWQLRQWAKRDGTGVAFDSNGGFVLPNGAKRSPDASWVLRSRLASLTPEQKRVFLPLCPDFTAELRSPSDNLQDTQAKMAEYIANGARLGLLIDPSARKVYVYRPGAPVQELDDPVTVAGDPELPGFTLNARDVFQTSF